MESFPKLLDGLYITLYFWYMFKFTDLKPFKRFIIPCLAIIGSGIILYGGINNPSIRIYLVVSFIIILLGLPFYRKDV